MQQTVESKTKQNDQQKSDIVDLILNDHKSLKGLIEVMKNPEKSQEERYAAFEEFAELLLIHARTEEEVLYSRMKEDEELIEYAFEGDVEHNLADILVEEINVTSDEDMRAAQIKVLAELVEHHIEEEENEILPEFKKLCKFSERKELGDQFVKFQQECIAACNEEINLDPKVERLEQPVH